jgi:hypothetical protein
MMVLCKHSKNVELCSAVTWFRAGQHNAVATRGTATVRKTHREKRQTFSGRRQFKLWQPLYSCSPYPTIYVLTISSVSLLCFVVTRQCNVG